MFVLVTWFGQPHTLEVRRFDTRDDAELAAYTWLIENGIVGPEIPIDEALLWWFDSEDGEGNKEDWSVCSVIREVA